MGALPFLPLPLVAQDALHPADAIVIVGGDHKPERVAHGVALYKQGYAPVVILSTGTMVWEGEDYIAEAEVLRRQSLALGLPSEAILIEDASNSTAENALFTAQLSEAQGFDSLLLVTSPYHSRRARHIFQAHLPPTLHISTQPAPLPFCHLCWLWHPDYGHTVLYEYYNWARLFFGI
jgi:uncharacterized SAM-binding protein YcdF (DUF218 family)